MGQDFIVVWIWIQPFDLMQKIQVIVDSNIVEEVSETFQNLEATIVLLCEKYNTEHVVIQGAPQIQERIYERLADLKEIKGE